MYTHFKSDLINNMDRMRFKYVIWSFNLSSAEGAYVIWLGQLFSLFSLFRYYMYDFASKNVTWNTVWNFNKMVSIPDGE